MSLTYHWYEGRREGLGWRFLQRVIGEGRRANVLRFPFCLWFKVYPDESIVVGCLHAKRDVALARERVKGVIEIPRKPPDPGPG